MTDADVDGAHIRTLLLTFFYRHMFALIENGYVYIAQPPLYKVKSGKQEAYVKDDHELSEWLLKSAMNNVQLIPASGQEALPTENLAEMVRQQTAVLESIQRLSRRYDRKLLETLFAVAPVPATEEALSSWGENIGKILNINDKMGFYEIQTALQGGSPSARITRRLHGAVQTIELGPDFFTSQDYQRMAKLRAASESLMGEGAEIRRGEKVQAVESFDQAYDWIQAEARRGLGIQRYKGLGEMNPEQLFTTTLDPENRRLVRVMVEDAVAADQMFTTLMGEQVEPRREFIEKHALQVGNLDI